MNYLGEPEEISKICLILLGETNVGKTSLMTRFTQNKFYFNQLMTYGINFVKKEVKLDEEKKIDLKLWDTAGQERFSSLGPMYFKKANGIVLVYDITSTDSFDRVQHWVYESKKYCNNELPLVLVGNKTDLQSERQIKEELGRNLSKSMNAKFFETSAKSGNNVVKVFEDFSKEIFVKLGGQLRNFSMSLGKKKKSKKGRC